MAWSVMRTEHFVQRCKNSSVDEHGSCVSPLYLKRNTKVNCNRNEVVKSLCSTCLHFALCFLPQKGGGGKVKRMYLFVFYLFNLQIHDILMTLGGSQRRDSEWRGIQLLSMHEKGYPSLYLFWYKSLHNHSESHSFPQIY